MMETESVVAIASAVVAVASLGLAYVAVLADHERRRKQATIEAWREYLKDMSTHRNTLRQFYGNGSIPQTDARALAAATPDLVADDVYGWMPGFQLALQDILGGLEHVAAGTNLAVYDLRVLDDIGGGAIKHLVDSRLKFVIAEARQDGSTKVYREMLHLCDSLKSFDGERRGKLKRFLPGLTST